MKNKRSFFFVFFLLIFTCGLLSSCSFGKGSSDPVMSETSLNLTAGSSANLSVTDHSGPLTWSSSDDNIASVDDGTVRAKSAGSAVIKATDEKGKSCSCNITVTEKEITKLVLDHQTASVNEGKTIQLTATFTPTDATDTNLTWSSSDEAVAVVNSEGYVTGVKDGVANITCKASNSVEASCTVTVKGTAASSQSNNNNNNNNNNAVQTPPANNNPYGHYAPSYTYNASDFVFPESSVRQLTRAEITSVLSSMRGTPVSTSFAQDAINEIYARNGYCFKEAPIRSYYESKPWYYADASFTTSDFNSVENYNINLLLNYN